MRPRFSNSRIAEARLGIRFRKRHVSTVRSSVCDSMPWRRSPVLSSPIPLPPERQRLMSASTHIG